jgi:hypothetical protein
MGKATAFCLAIQAVVPKDSEKYLIFNAQQGGLDGEFSDDGGVDIAFMGNYAWSLVNGKYILVNTESLGVRKLRITFDPATWLLTAEFWRDGNKSLTADDILSEMAVLGSYCVKGSDRWITHDQAAFDRQVAQMQQVAQANTTQKVA